MPAPDDFNGIFYSMSTGGTHEIFDNTSEQFIAMCEEAENQLGSAQFFVAGALSDLLWMAKKTNDFHERYEVLVKAAQEKWPANYWFAIPIVVSTARAILKEGVDQEKVEHGVFREIAVLFRASVLEQVGKHTFALVNTGEAPKRTDII